MSILWYIIAGILGGVLGGMGMGGGTVLIPLLGIFYKVSQHTAQAVNLISFIPMSIIAVIIHAKNKLIDFSKVMWVIIPGIITCILGSFVAKSMEGELLRRCFGGFLLALSVFQFIMAFRQNKE